MPISTTMRGDGLTVAGTRLGEARLQARLRDRDLEADLSLPEPGLAVVAAGRLAPGGTIVARLRAHDVDVTGLAGQHLPPWASGLVGRLSAVGELTAPFDRPVAAEGVLRIELPQLTVSGEEWRVRGPVVVRRRPGVTMVERVEARAAWWRSGPGPGMSNDGDPVSGRANAGALGWSWALLGVVVAWSRGRTPPGAFFPIAEDALNCARRLSSSMSFGDAPLDHPLGATIEANRST